jgi:hypothetical protein
MACRQPGTDRLLAVQPARRHRSKTLDRLAKLRWRVEYDQGRSLTLYTLLDQLQRLIAC